MSTNTTYGFTETELDIAKHTDLLSLLPSLGYTLKRIGSYYTTAEMDSIRIRDPTRWKRYSTKQSGDAITFSITADAASSGMDVPSSSPLNWL